MRERGALFETLVFAEIAKTVPRDWTVHYWRAKGGAEVDFVLVRGIAKPAEFYGPERVARRLVAHTGQDTFLIDGDVRAVPGWERERSVSPFDSLPPTP